MDIIYSAAVWYNNTFNHLFALIGVDMETPEGIVILAVFIIVSHALGNYFHDLAERCADRG